jgi:hypothetical protein
MYIHLIGITVNIQGQIHEAIVDARNPNGENLRTLFLNP